MVERYYNKDKTAIAVLVSHGYGGGWSTWCGETEEPYQLAYDKQVVEFWLAHRDDDEYIENLCDILKNDDQKEAEEFFESLGYRHVFFGGFSQITLHWVPVGSKFEIAEYDGAESLRVLDDISFAIA